MKVTQKSWFALIAATSLMACAPPEMRDDADEAVGESTSRQTTTATRVLVRSVVGQARFLTVDTAPAGAIEEARYGIRADGGLPLHSCWAGGIVPSMGATCEGLGPMLGVIGHLHPSAGVPLYRCVGASGRFPTTDPGCQGQGVREGLLGFVDTATPEAWAFPPPGMHGGDGDGTGGAGGGGGGGGGVGAGGSL